MSRRHTRIILQRIESKEEVSNRPRDSVGMQNGPISADSSSYHIREADFSLLNRRDFFRVRSKRDSVTCGLGLEAVVQPRIIVSQHARIIRGELDLFITTLLELENNYN